MKTVYTVSTAHKMSKKHWH